MLRPLFETCSVITEEDSKKTRTRLEQDSKETQPKKSPGIPIEQWGIIWSFFAVGFSPKSFNQLNHWRNQWLSWQDGYGAFTYSVREKDMIITYIKNQKEHHKKETFHDEFKRLLIENEITFDEKYLS